MISHKTHTFNNYYIIGKQNSQYKKSYLQEHSAQTCAEKSISLIRNCKLRASCDKLNVPSADSINRNILV